MMNDWHQLKSLIREVVRQVVRTELEKAMAAQKAEILEMLEQLLDRSTPVYMEAPTPSSGTDEQNGEDYPEPLAELLSTLSHEIDRPADILEDNLASPASLQFSTGEPPTLPLEDHSGIASATGEAPLDLSPDASLTGLGEMADLGLETSLERTAELTDVPDRWTEEPSPPVAMSSPTVGTGAFTETTGSLEIQAEVSATPIDIHTLEQKRQELLRQLAELEGQAIAETTVTQAVTELTDTETSPESLLHQPESELADAQPQEAIGDNPEDKEENLDETDRLLNEFADQEEPNQQSEIEAPAIPEPTYNPTNPWFLGIDYYDQCLSLALTDSVTRRTYNLQFASNKRSNYLPLGDDWRLDQCWDTSIPQALQNSYEQKVQDILAKVITDLRHPQLPTSDMPLIFENLRGIIVSLPIGYSTAYGVRFRQALLQAGWATRPESILVLDRAIAPLLAVIERQKEVKNIYHLSIHCTDESTTIALSVKPLAFVNLPYGYEFVEHSLKEAISKNIFNHIPEPDTVKYLVHICQAHFHEPSQQKWEYEWQNQPITVDRSQIDQCQQLALRQWLALVGPHINQFLSQLPDHTPAQIWLMGKLPIGFWEWLSGKLAPARPQMLPEQAVTEGLAVAPFWREYLDIVKLQYSDYFLIHEICALRLPDPCTFNTITDALLQRGVNVRACLDRLQQIVNQGVPSHLGLGQDSRSSRLFQPTPDGKLSPCRDNMLMIRSHLQQLQYGLRQNLAEPLVFPHYP